MSSSSKVKTLAAKVALATVALVLMLLVLEFLTRMVFDNNGMHFAIEMWKYAKIMKRDARIDGAGHEHIPGLEARLMGTDVKINSLGLRDYEYPTEKTPDVLRVLVLGDSITFGWGADLDDTYSKVLERKLNDEADAQSPSFEVISSGVGNYNSVMEVSYLAERGLLLDPDVVILGFFLNDAEPLPTPTKGFLAEHSYLYVFAAAGFDAISRQFLGRGDWRDYYSGLYDESNPGWADCQAALRELSTICQDRDIPLLVMLIPELHQLGEVYPFTDVHQKVAAIFDEQHIEVLDATSAFTGEDPPTLWVSRQDAHPNAKGHAILAEALYNRFGDQLRHLALEKTKPDNSGHGEPAAN